jgi:hypothetical protein
MNEIQSPFAPGFAGGFFPGVRTMRVSFLIPLLIAIGTTARAAESPKPRPCPSEAYLHENPATEPRIELEIRISIRIKKSAQPAREPTEDSRRTDLLAPRNVLNRQAAVETTGDEAYQPFADDTLFETPRLQDIEIRLISDEPWLAEKPSPEAKALSERLFLIKDPPSQRRAPRPRPRHDLRDYRDQSREFDGMLLAAVGQGSP